MSLTVSQNLLLGSPGGWEEEEEEAEKEEEIFIKWGYFSISYF